MPNSTICRRVLFSFTRLARMHWLVRSGVVLLIALSGSLVSAQTRKSVQDFRVWYMYFGDHPFGDGPWGFHFDGQLRNVGFAEARNQLLLRPGINFDVSPSAQLAGGYAFIDTGSDRSEHSEQLL